MTEGGPSTHTSLALTEPLYGVHKDCSTF